SRPPRVPAPVTDRIAGGRMLNQTHARFVRRAAPAMAVLVLTSAAAGLEASNRQVSVESLIYDLKSPDAVRRQAAAKELAAVKYRAAIPNLIPLTRDPVAAVRREVELTLEAMDDIQTL